MRRHRRAATAALLALGCLALARGLVPGRAPAEAPARTAQGVRLKTPEPPPPEAQPPAEGPPAEGPPAEGPPPGPPNFGPPAGPAEPVDPPAPLVTIRVRVPAQGSPGQELVYRITVENCSRAAAHHVVVRSRLPDNVTLVRARPEPMPGGAEMRWELGTLAASACKEIVLVVKPTGKGDVRNCARVQFEHGQCVSTRIARPELRLRKTGPAQAVLHEAMAFTLEVTNTGRARAADVVLTDTLPEGLELLKSKPANPSTWNLGALEPGQTRRVEYQAASTRTGTFTNRAVVTAAGGLRQEAAHTVRVAEAKLALTKSGPARRLVNRAAVYRITLSNPGAVPATNVRVEDDLFYDERLRAGLQLVRASGGGRQQGRGVRWSLGTLPPGAGRTLELVVRARQPGKFTNVVSATADHDVSARAAAPTTAFAEAGAAPDIEIDKGVDPLRVGGQTTYTLRLLNPGKAAATRLGLTVTVPDRMKFLNATGPTAPAEGKQRIKFAPLATLRPGAEVVYTVTVRAESAGAALLRAELTSDPPGPGGPVSREETTTITGPAPSGPDSTDR